MSDVTLTAVGLGREVNGSYQRVDIPAGKTLPSWVSAEDRESLRAAGAILASEAEAEAEVEVSETKVSKDK